MARKNIGRRVPKKQSKAPSKAPPQKYKRAVSMSLREKQHRRRHRRSEPLPLRYWSALLLSDEPKNHIGLSDINDYLWDAGATDASTYPGHDVVLRLATTKETYPAIKNHIYQRSPRKNVWADCVLDKTYSLHLAVQDAQNREQLLLGADCFGTLVYSVYHGLCFVVWPSHEGILLYNVPAMTECSLAIVPYCHGFFPEQLRCFALTPEENKELLGSELPAPVANALVLLKRGEEGLSGALTNPFIKQCTSRSISAEARSQHKKLSDMSKDIPIKTLVSPKYLMEYITKADDVFGATERRSGRVEWCLQEADPLRAANARVRTPRGLLLEAIFMSNTSLRRALYRNIGGRFVRWPNGIAAIDSADGKTVELFIQAFVHVQGSKPHRLFVREAEFLRFPKAGRSSALLPSGLTGLSVPSRVFNELAPLLMSALHKAGAGLLPSPAELRAIESINRLSRFSERSDTPQSCTHTFLRACDTHNSGVVAVKKESYASYAWGGRVTGFGELFEQAHRPRPPAPDELERLERLRVVVEAQAEVGSTPVVARRGPSLQRLEGIMKRWEDSVQSVLGGTRPQPAPPLHADIPPFETDFPVFGELPSFEESDEDGGDNSF